MAYVSVACVVLVFVLYALPRVLASWAAAESTTAAATVEAYDKTMLNISVVRCPVRMELKRALVSPMRLTIFVLLKGDRQCCHFICSPSWPCGTSWQEIPPCWCIDM